MNTDANDSADDRTADELDSTASVRNSATPSVLTVTESQVEPLEEWAERCRVADDPYIEGILGAARNSADITPWASLDPLEHLPHPDPLKGRKLQGLARFLVFVRNVAVFVPVLLTWFGISRATSAFGRYSQSADADAQLNFLQFWQLGGPLEGPRWLDEFWRIQSIALHVVYLIGAIIALTFLAGGLEALHGRRSRLQRTTIERERMAVALALTAALHRKRQADPESVAQSLAESLNELVSAANIIHEAAQRLEAATVGVDAMAPRIDTLNGNFESLGDQLVGRVAASVDSLVTSVQRLDTAIDRDLERRFIDLLEELDKVNESLDRSSSTVSVGTLRLREDLDAIHLRLAQLTNGQLPDGAH